MRSVLVAVALALVLAACSEVAPEFTQNDQVPADQRTEEVAEGEDVAAAEPADASQADGVFTAEGGALEFASAPETLPAGEVTIALQNDGTLTHNVVFRGINGDSPIVEAAAEEVAVDSVTVEPGTVDYYCNVPGHEAAGMVGSLTVE